MEEVSIKQYANGRQAFVVEDNNKKLGEMVMQVNGNVMTVYHTEVVPEAEGRGLAKLLFNSMVDYARLHHLKVVPLCAFVYAQFNRHPDLYTGIWQKGKA